MITLVILVGVGTAVDGVVELLEPPGARAVLLGDAAARGHLPVEGLGELLSEHFCFGDGSSRNVGNTGHLFFIFFQNWCFGRYIPRSFTVLFFSPFSLSNSISGIRGELTVGEGQRKRDVQCSCLAKTVRL